ALPRNFPLPKENSIKAITGEPQKTALDQIDVGVLSELLFFSAGLTRKVRFGKELYYMRAASATGALYPIEIYVVSGRIPGLEAGVYHFNPLHFSLVKLREGDYRTSLDDAGSADSLSAPFTLAFTSLAWRNAWKYEARSYRHWFWDSGVIAANLLATSNSAGLSTEVVLGFVDSEVDRLLGLEAKKEATVALAVVGIGHTEKATRMNQPIPSLAIESNPPQSQTLTIQKIGKPTKPPNLKAKSRPKPRRTSK